MSKTVWVIEDDEAIRESIVELLDSEGYAVVASENGQQALDKLAETSAVPNLFLLDLMMPVMDGFAFSDAKSKIDRLRNVPTIVMSADGHIQVKQGRTGATAYLRKPVDIDALAAKVAELI